MRALIVALGILSLVTGRIPRARIERWCRLAGRVWYLAAPHARAAVRSNLRHVLGREPRPATVRTVFEYGMLNYWDTLSIRSLGRCGLDRVVHLAGVHHIDEARARGRGVIVVGPHVGSIALAVQALAVRYPVTGVVEEIKPPELLQFWLEQRSALGLRLVGAGPQAVRVLLAALRHNEVVVIVSDKDVNDTGAFVEFFGEAARIPDGPAALALRTGAVMLAATTWRRPGGEIEVRVESPIEAVRTGDAAADRRALTQAMARRLEYHVASHPEQWTVFEQRWPAE